MRPVPMNGNGSANGAARRSDPGPPLPLLDVSEKDDSRRDHRAIVALKAGHADALHYLYVRYHEDVIKVIRGIVRDHHETEDIAQSVFAKLPRVISRYERREVPFAAWISRVARNAALDHLRTRRQIPVEEVRLTDAGSDQIAFERSRALQIALKRLPKDQRLVIAMRYIAGMTPGEIAERMGKTEPAVHGLHHRGRVALREMLIELEVAPTTAH